MAVWSNHFRDKHVGRSHFGKRQLPQWALQGYLASSHPKMWNSTFSSLHLIWLRNRDHLHHTYHSSLSLVLDQAQVSMVYLVPLYYLAQVGIHINFCNPCIITNDGTDGFIIQLYRTTCPSNFFTCTCDDHQSQRKTNFSLILLPKFIVSSFDHKNMRGMSSRASLPAT